MNRRSFFAVFLTGLLALLLALVPCALAAESYEAGTMRLLRYEGSVEILDPEGLSRFVLENVRFASGESLRTGEDGMASVGLDDTKIVTLDSSSQVEFLQEDNHIRMCLTEGALFLDVQESLDENEGLDIQTTTMTVGIRGTIVFVSERDAGDGSNAKVTSLGVLEGTAHVNYTDTSGGSRLLEVNAGNIVSVPVPQEGQAGVSPSLSPLTAEDIQGFVADTVNADPVLTERVENGSDQGSSLLSGEPGDSSGSENPENSWAANGNWAWPGTITLVAQSASKLYDGQPLVRPSDALVYGLPGDFSIAVSCSGSQTAAGSCANQVSSWKIINAVGEDVTSHFHSVETVDGTLRVDPAPLVVWTGSDEKVYDGESLICEEAEIRTVPGHTAEDPVWRNTSVVTQTALGSEKMIAVSGVTYVVGTNPITGQSEQFALRTGQTLTVCLHGEGDQQTIEFNIETLEVKDLPEEVLRLYADNPELLAQACEDAGWDPEEVMKRFSELSAPATATVRQNGLNVSGDSRDSLMVDSANVRIHIDTQFTNYSSRALTGDEATFTPIVLDPSIVITATGEQTGVGESVNTYEIDWGNADAANFVLQEDLGTLTVKPLDLQVNVGGGGGVYNGYPFTLRPYVTYMNGEHAGERVEGVRLRAEAPGNTVSDTPANAGSTVFRFTLFTGDTLELTVSGWGTGAGIYDLTYSVTSSSEHIGSINLAYAGTRIYIDPAELTIATGSASKPYDGTPVTSAEVTVTGLVGNDNITVKAAGTQTEVGESSNTYEIDWGSVNPKNYRITEELGTLTVTEPETKAVTVTVTGNRASAAYTGEAQKAEGYTVSFSDPAYTEKDFTFTGTAAAKGTVPGTYPMGLTSEQFRNTSDKFDVTFRVTDGELAITPNEDPVTLTAGSAEKVYDGTALRSGEITAEGLPSGSFRIEAKTAGTQTDAGTSGNKITEYRILYAAPDSDEEPADVTEYFSSVTLADGTLTVTPLAVTVTVTGNTASLPYSGEEQQVTGYTVSSSSPLLTEADIDFTGNAAAKGTDVSVEPYPMGLKAEQFAGTSDNFEVTFTVTDGSLTITPLAVAVTVTGSIASLPYNGAEQQVEGYSVSSSSPLFTADSISFTGDALAKGTVVSDEPYPMGLAAEQFTCTNNNFEAAITVADGSLTITPLAVTVTITGLSNSGRYGGGEFQLSGYHSSFSDPLYTDDDFTFSGNKFVKGTDAGTYYMGMKADQFTNINPNFEASFDVTDGVLTITPCPVSVATGSYSKLYDGTPLTGGEPFTVNLMASGTQTLTVTPTGSQTEIGSSENTCTLAWNNAKESNYDLTLTLGTLEVFPDKVLVVDLGCHTYTWDGNWHTPDRARVFYLDGTEVAGVFRESSSGTLRGNFDINGNNLYIALNPERSFRDEGSYSFWDMGNLTFEDASYELRYINDTLTIEPAASLTGLSAAPPASSPVPVSVAAPKAFAKAENRTAETAGTQEELPAETEMTEELPEAKEAPPEELPEESEIPDDPPAAAETLPEELPDDSEVPEEDPPAAAETPLEQLPAGSEIPDDPPAVTEILPEIPPAESEIPADPPAAAENPPEASPAESEVPEDLPADAGTSPAESSPETEYPEDELPAEAETSAEEPAAPAEESSPPAEITRPLSVRFRQKLAAVLKILYKVS